MSSPPIAGFLTRLGPSPLDGLSDADLVREYAATGSDAAFAELVRRFAPLVWGVCRRTVGHRQLAEDAFQAAFVVLARKAGSIRPPPAVGGWLHAVAVHTSLRVRTMSDRRRKRHRPLVADPAAPTLSEPIDPAALRALDEEIARLPAAQRTAVALCELGGLSRKDAAARLGVAEGTLSSRLAAARKALAARLRGRGITLAAALVVVSTADAAPAVPSTPSDTVSFLADGVIRAMFLNKLKLPVVLALAAVALLAVGGSLLAAPPDRERYQIKAPVPRDKDAGKLYVWCDDGFKVFAPDGKELDAPPQVKPTDYPMWHGAAISRDGTHAAYDVLTDYSAANSGPRTKVYVRKLSDTGGGVEVVPNADTHLVAWAADNTLYLTGLPHDSKGLPTKTVKVWAYAAETKKLTEVKLPDGHILEHILPDGKTAVTEKWVITKASVERKMYRVSVADGKATELCDLGKASFSGKLSPGGDQLLGVWNEWSRVEPHGDDGFVMRKPIVSSTPTALDVATGKRSEWKQPADTPQGSMAWSPDGKRVAVLSSKPKAEAAGPPLTPEQRKAKEKEGASGKEAFEYTLTVMNADGSNAKEVGKVDGLRLRGFDWR